MTTAQVDTPAQNGAGEVQPITERNVPENVRELMRRMDLVATVGTTGAALDIMARILDAESEEDILAAANAGTISGQDIPGRPFLLHGVEWKQSAPAFIAQGGFPFYGLADVTFLDTGDQAVLTCGGFTFVSVVENLGRRGHLDKYPDGFPMVLESRRMQSGFDVLIPHKYTAPAAAK